MADGNSGTFRKIVTKTETITPEKAAELLKSKNDENRPIRKRSVDRLAAEMRTGKWTLTHQGIAFGADGSLMDGQHRLAACVESGVPFETNVSRYCTEEDTEKARPAIDAGNVRDAADISVFCKMMTKGEAKELSALINVALLLDGSPVTDRRASTVIAALPRYGAPGRWTLAKLPGKRFPAPLRAAFALMWMAYPEEADAFASTIFSGVVEAGTAAATWMRGELCGQLRTSGGEGERRKVAQRALRIMKAHVCKEGDLSRIYTTDEGLSFFLRRIEKKSKEASHV